MSKRKNDDIEAAARQRAAKRLGIEPWVDGEEYVAHWKNYTGITLCGRKTNSIALNPDEAEPCATCAARLDKYVAELVADEVRNYWSRPAAGEPFVRSKEKQKPKIKYERVPLPDEYLPTGSGKLVREVKP